MLEEVQRRRLLWKKNIPMTGVSTFTNLMGSHFGANVLVGDYDPLGKDEANYGTTRVATAV